jgi:glycosyltransferase involved in cell wall biosynthesis
MSAEPIRVHHVLTRLNIGGLTVLGTLLCRYLGPPEFESCLLTGTTELAEAEGDMAYYARERGIEPRYVPGLRRRVSPWHDLCALVALWRLFRRERPTIVHTHQVKAGVVARVAAWLSGVPITVHTFHAHAFSGYFGPLEPLYRALERWLCRRTTCLVTVNELQLAELGRYGIRSRRPIELIPYGLELDSFAAAERHNGRLRTEFAIAADAPLVGFCGRLQPVKRPDLFVELAQRVHAGRPDARFVLIGDGWLRGQLERQVVAAGLTGVVHLAGWQRQPAPALADLDLLVNMALIEGTPLVVLEAAAAGVPTVASDVGGCAGVIAHGETGWLIAYEDLDAAAEAVLAALTDPERLAQVGAQARERVLREHGSGGAMAAAHGELYRRLVAETVQ